MALALLVVASIVWVYAIVAGWGKFNFLFIVNLTSSGVMGWNWKAAMLFLGVDHSVNNDVMISTLSLLAYLLVLLLVALIIRMNIKESS